VLDAMQKLNSRGFGKMETDEEAWFLDPYKMLTSSENVYEDDQKWFNCVPLRKCTICFTEGRDLFFETLLVNCMSEYPDSNATIRDLLLGVYISC
jgi:hypothetical protein